MVEYFVGALIERGITVKKFNLAKTDTGKLAMALVDAATIVIGSPAVLAGPHPKRCLRGLSCKCFEAKAKVCINNWVLWLEWKNG